VYCRFFQIVCKAKTVLRGWSWPVSNLGIPSQLSSIEAKEKHNEDVRHSSPAGDLR
jgi:hypothetical protein